MNFLPNFDQKYCMTKQDVKLGVPSQVNFVITLVVFVDWMIIFATYRWNYSKEIVPDAVSSIQACALIVAGLMFVLNLVVVFMISGLRSRFLHLFLASAFLIVCWATFSSDRHHVGLRRSWFIQEGILRYEVVVKMIKTNSYILTDKPQVVRQTNAFITSICACTNKDGSLTVWISPRENNSRLGYIYTSGAILAVDPSDSNNPNFYHITNGWYEF